MHSCLVLFIRPFWSCDLDLNPMTSIYELNLIILKMYLLTNEKLSYTAEIARDA